MGVTDEVDPGDDATYDSDPRHDVRQQCQHSAPSNRRVTLLRPHHEHVVVGWLVRGGYHPLNAALWFEELKVRMAAAGQ